MKVWNVFLCVVVALAPYANVRGDEIEDALDAYQDAVADLVELQSAYDVALAITDPGYVSDLEDLLDDAESSYDDATAALASSQAALDALMLLFDPQDLEDAQDALVAAVAAYDDAQENIDPMTVASLEASVDSAQDALDTANDNLSDAQDALALDPENEQLAEAVTNAQASVTDAENGVNSAENALSDYTSSAAEAAAIDAAQEAVDAITEPIEAAEASVTMAQESVDAASETLDSAQDEWGIIVTAEDQVLSLPSSIDIAIDVVGDANDVLLFGLSGTQAQIGYNTFYRASSQAGALGLLSDDDHKEWAHISIDYYVDRINDFILNVPNTSPNGAVAAMKYQMSLDLGKANIARNSADGYWTEGKEDYGDGLQRVTWSYENGVLNEDWPEAIGQGTTAINYFTSAYDWASKADVKWGEALGRLAKYEATLTALGY